MKSITLYHFTRVGYVERIKAEGITRGDVPTTPSEGFNAPWLTSDPIPSAQGWAGADKQKIRITVTIQNKRLLRKWSQLAKELKVEDWWYDALDKAGGGGSNNWYVYLGKISPKWIKKIEVI